MPIQTILRQLSEDCMWINDLQKSLLPMTIEHIDYVHGRHSSFPKKLFVKENEWG